MTSIMPPKKPNVHNQYSKNARRMRANRAHESEEQIAARNATQRMRTAEIRRQESREQRDDRLRQNKLRTRSARERHKALFRLQARSRMDKTPITHTNNTARLLRLIESVKKRPTLWNLDAEGYSNKFGKSELWAEISREVGYDELEAKQTWKKLRDIHRDSVKRRRNKLLQPWKFSKQMEFLLPHMKKRALDEGDEVYSISDAVKRSRKYKKRQFSDATSDTDSEAAEESDALGRFFDAMQDTTRKLPGLLQLQIKRKVFQVVSEAEERYLRNLDDSDPEVLVDLGVVGEDEQNGDNDTDKQLNVKKESEMEEDPVKIEVEDDYAPS